MQQRLQLLTEENLPLALVLGAFMPDVSEDTALVATFAMGGAQSGRNGWWLIDSGEQLANGLGIVKHISIS